MFFTLGSSFVVFTFFLPFFLPLPHHLIALLFVFFTSFSVPVVFAIGVLNDLEVDKALFEEDILVELLEMRKGIGEKTNFMLIGMNLHSYC